MVLPKYQDWLAAEVINESNTVSYRSLSRALKVHSNAAKEMLYDFHRSQNARKPGSIHATYLLCGIRKPEIPSTTNGNGKITNGDGDVPMSDISFLSSSMPGQDVESTAETIPVTTIILAKEEDLEGVKDSFEVLESIHVYSLEPSSIKNIQTLSDCNRKIASTYASEDLLQTWKQYGTIYNPMAKRREGARPPPPAVTKPAAPAAPAAPPAAAKAPAKTPAPADVKPALSRTASTKSDTSKPEPVGKKGTTKAPTLKKESSSIFKAFAAKPKPTAKRETSASGVSAAPSPAAQSPKEDETMLDASEDEQEDAFAGNALDRDDARAKADAARKAKEDREETLKKMMDEDEDEPMEEADPAEGTTTAPLPLEPTADGQSLQPQQEDKEPQVTIANGRRRGRRRVMKKKTTKDAEGYLVTKEEMAWESFSESDKEPAQKKAKPVEKPTEKPGAKKGAAGGKKGQGNIMSFFAKK